ncbi:geranylgeranyl diphosphate synthase type I [Asanoa ferruginea]|uniref:Geranylgeranyl diphosphate synthase type I n=1 Tax=Asanoa ferruginea TaxID=53367 RepID=A0A3D9ZWN9_9ACTN|nr:polyprenyl synthetase family protein [Asanoa ferruginea]REG00973.1 geranylgeranyl diphosphate synthase type I [Asanoa ferruginea]GIF47572.1 geranylgeranyl pyrophosphate synthase [Asanoa ferruginea]
MTTIDTTLGERAPTAPPRKVREHLMELLEERLRAFFREEQERRSTAYSSASDLVSSVADLVGAGGKRVRPAFCISGYLAAGGDPDDHRVLRAAVALELLHAAALIHDDIMDAATRRRGVPTVHEKHSASHRSGGWRGEDRRYGEGVAVLAGDLALVYADQFMATAPAMVDALWAELRTELIVGQFVDVHVAAAAEFPVDPDLARWIALSKSGRYTIHRPLEVGAAIAGRPDLGNAFEAYGAAIGEAFQLRDDIMDAFGDGQVTGKPDGLDLTSHKMTLLLGAAMERDLEIRDLVHAGEMSAGSLRTRLRETGVRVDIERHIDRLVDDGCQAIAKVPLAAGWREELVEMARLVAYRDC